MSKTPKVSIVCVTYNQEQYIEQALQGFVAQKTSFPFEVIVADDCSTDSTPTIVTKFAKEYPDLFRPILRKKNLGVTKNFKSVLQAATGEYIAICEGDDYWTDPEKLQTQVDYLDKHPSYVGCFHTVRVIFEKNLKEEFIFPEVKDLAWYTTEELLKTNYIPTNSVMYRRQDYSDLATNVMPFDWYLHLYHAQFGKIGMIDKVMSVYRKHEQGLWWEYDVDRSKIWQQHGLSYLAFLNEVLSMYLKNPARREVIEEAINNMLSTLIEIDDTQGKDLFEKALKAYPERAEPFMYDQSRKLRQKSKEADDLKRQLLAVGDERGALVLENGDLKFQLAQKTEELQAITGSKKWRLVKRLTVTKKKVERS